MFIKKNAVLISDFFWSTVPYDGLRLYDKLSKVTSCDLLMFKDDIRLNKKFTGNEKFHFDIAEFTSRRPILLKDWSDFVKKSANYESILCSSHIAPKIRFPKGLRDAVQCNLCAWDIGGADILTNATHFATHFFVKGNIWKNWLVRMGYNENNIFVTGSPHYDPYLGCNTKTEKGSILVVPSNPKSHQEQFKQNMHVLTQLSHEKNIKVYVKTYPHDYLFYESERKYTGVYRRPIGNKPQYEMLKSMFPTFSIVDSQNHFEVMSKCEKIFNMSGSHISWETYFTGVPCYAMNMVGKSYHKGVSYLPEYVVYPDDLVNIHIDSIDKMLGPCPRIDYSGMSDYILKENAVDNIVTSFLNI